MNRNLTEDQKDIAINGYLMSLAIFITTLPIPVLNLLANLFYYFSYRKNTYIIRWHTFNSLLSQIPLFFINSSLWYLGWKIVWSEITISNTIIAYFCFALILNIGEILSSIICCIKVNQKKNLSIPIISPIAHLTCRKITWDKWEKTWKKADDFYLQFVESSKGKLVKDIVLFLMLSVVLIGSIKLFDPVEKFNIKTFSIENFLAETMYENSIKDDLIEDETAQQQLQYMVDFICKENGLDSINAYIIKKEEINAFAYPGRNIVVHNSLISTCQSESELASVLGHEIAHIEKKHVIESLKTNIGTSIIALAILGDYSNIITTISSNRLSQANEEEADHLAIEYINNAQYDPNGFISFMKIIDEKSIDLPLNSILSTHPRTKDRIKNAEKQIKSLEPKEPKNLLSENSWKRFKEKVK